MEGLRRGWTESLRVVDREEALAQQLANDGRFDELDVEGNDPSAGLDGEPIPTPSRLAPSNPNAAQLYSPLKVATSPAAASPKRASESEPDLARSKEDVPPPTHIPPQPPLLLVPFTNYIGFKQIPLMIADFFYQRAKVKSGAEAAYRLVMGHHRPISAPNTSENIDNWETQSDATSNDLDFGLDSESYYPSSTRTFAADIEQARSEYYAALPTKLNTARALACGEREPTKDETNYPPPTEVELRAERLKKELRWTGDLVGWDILNPEKGVAWDDRFREALSVFVDPRDETHEGVKLDHTDSS